MDPNSAPGTPSNGASTRGIPDGRRRRIALIAALALAAGIAAAAGVLLLGGDDGAGQEAASGKPLAGQPLLVLDLPGKPLPAHASAQQALATANSAQSLAQAHIAAGAPRVQRRTRLVLQPLASNAAARVRKTRAQAAVCQLRRFHLRRVPPDTRQNDEGMISGRH